MSLLLAFAHPPIAEAQVSEVASIRPLYAILRFLLFLLRAVSASVGCKNCIGHLGTNHSISHILQAQQSLRHDAVHWITAICTLQLSCHGQPWSRSTHSASFGEPGSSIVSDPSAERVLRAQVNANYTLVWHP